MASSVPASAARALLDQVRAIPELGSSGATEERPFLTLVTSGMSERLQAPGGASAAPHWRQTSAPSALSVLQLEQTLAMNAAPCSWRVRT